MPIEPLIFCLATLEIGERMLIEADDLAAAVHVTLAIDRVRAAHGLPDRALGSDWENGSRDGPARRT